MRGTPVAAVAGLAVWLVSQRALLADTRDLMKAGVAANVGQIKSLYADVAWSSRSGGKEVRKTGTYTRRDDVVRMTETSPDRQRVTDVLIERGVCKVFSGGPGARKGAGYTDLLIGAGHRKSVDVDLWEHCLFVLPVTVYKKPPLPAYSAEAALSRGEVLEDRMTTAGGGRLAFARVKVDVNRTYDVYADPSKNWAVTRCVHRIDDDAGHRLWDADYVADRWKEFSGVFVPTKVVASIRYRSGDLITQTVELDNVLVNSPDVPPIRPLPIGAEGATAFDEVNNVTYRTNQAGTPIGEIYRVGDDYLPPSPRAAPPDRRSVSALGLAVAAALCGAGGAMYVRRRRRVALPS